MIINSNLFSIAESGELYTFGESDGGKLGLGDADIKAFVPTKVELPEKAKQVSCGNTHTVVLLGKTSSCSCSIEQSFLNLQKKQIF